MDGGKDGWIEAEGDSQGSKPRCLAELEKMQSSRAESVGGLAATEGRKRARPARQRGWWARTQFWLQFWLRANAWPRGSLDCARARARARALAIWVLLWGASTAKARPGLREWVAWAHASPPSLRPPRAAALLPRNRARIVVCESDRGSPTRLQPPVLLHDPRPCFNTTSTYSVPSLSVLSSLDPLHTLSESASAVALSQIRPQRQIDPTRSLHRSLLFDTIAPHPRRGILSTRAHYTKHIC